jgi:glutaredoxin 3
MTKEIVIYTTNVCPYCVSAKRLLDRKQLEYVEISLMDEPWRMTEMLQKSNGARTVPQIFIGGLHIGGYDDLAALDADGKLADLLAD